MKGLVKLCAALVVVAALASGLAACGSSNSEDSGTGSTAEVTTGSSEDSSSEGGQASIDLETTTLEVPKGTPKIGYFGFGVSAFDLAEKAEIEQMDKEGSDVTFLEAKFDPATQLKQLQTALTTGEYDAWIVSAVDPEGVCRVVTDQSTAQGIPVSVLTQPICGRSQNDWNEVWTPGTLNFVGDDATVTWLTNMLKGEKEVLGITASTKVGVVNGPDLAAAAQAYTKALEAADIEPVEVVKGDYTAPTAQKITQGMLSRNPEIEVILDCFEGDAPGVVAALKESGKAPGEIKIGDVGSSSEIMVPSIKNGWVAVSAAYAPRTIARTAVEQMEMAFNGEQGPRLLPADAEGGTLQKPFLLTKETVGSYKPQY